MNGSINGTLISKFVATYIEVTEIICTINACYHCESCRSLLSKSINIELFNYNDVNLGCGLSAAVKSLDSNDGRDISRGTISRQKLGRVNIQIGKAIPNF